MEMNDETANKAQEIAIKKEIARDQKIIARFMQRYGKEWQSLGE